MLVRSRWRFMIVAAVLTCLASTGCRVKEPGSLETRTIFAIKHHVTVGGKEHNPLPPTPEAIHRGQIAFSNYCFACHGLDGQKTGVPFADSMSPPVPSLAAPEVQSYSDGQLKWIIQNGIAPSGMPAANGILNDEEIWSIVLYLRHLPGKGSLGEPQSYSGEPVATSSAR